MAQKAHVVFDLYHFVLNIRSLHPRLSCINAASQSLLWLKDLQLTQLCLWLEALLFTSVYTQLHVPYDLASNGTAISRVC